MTNDAVLTVDLYATAQNSGTILIDGGIVLDAINSFTNTGNIITLDGDITVLNNTTIDHSGGIIIGAGHEINLSQTTWINRATSEFINDGNFIIY